MVRRVLLGLIIVVVCGAIANAAPIVYVEHAGGLLNGQFTDGTFTMNVSVSGMDTATTPNGVAEDSLVILDLVFEIDGDDSDSSALSYSNYVTHYTPAGTALFVDNDPSPFGLFSGSRNAVNLGQLNLAIAPPPGLGAAKTLIASFDVTISGGTAANTHLAIIAQGYVDATTATYPDPLLTSNTGNTPWDTVTNPTFAGVNTEVAGLPLVPEPATIALMLAACGGGRISRRRRI